MLNITAQQKSKIVRTNVIARLGFRSLKRIEGTKQSILCTFFEKIALVFTFLRPTRLISRNDVKRRNFYLPFTFYHAPMRAFTLAEVLITLGIIGVVAAMTIPTLVNSYQKTQTVKQLMNVFSMASQVVKLSENDNGPNEDWQWGTAGNHVELLQCFNTYLAPYMKVTKFCSSSSDCGYTNPQAKSLNGVPGLYMFMPQEVSTVLADGTFFGLVWDGFSKIIIVDLNSSKTPNTIGKDIFVFYLDSNGLSLYGKNSAREILLNATDHGCNKSASGIYCGALIQKDGWQIKDDYPWN